MNEATRAYIYRIVLALLAAGAAYGLLGPDEIPVWLEVVGAVLGIGASGLATKHTSTKES